MRKVTQKTIGPDLHVLIEKARLSDRDRQIATDAMRVAEGFADAVLWVKEKVAAIGTWFLRPSVKH